jgi:hypothetical protein
MQLLLALAELAEQVTAVVLSLVQMAQIQQHFL